MSPEALGWVGVAIIFGGPLFARDDRSAGHFILVGVGVLVISAVLGVLR